MRISAGPLGRTARRRTRSARLRFGRALVVLVPLAAACQGEPTTITGTIGAPRPVIPGTTGTGALTGGRDSRLAGKAWSRTVFVQDNSGAVHSSSTTWFFGTDGIATRAVVAANLTFGMVDRVVTFARWRTQGGAVILDYLPEGSGSARFEYSLQGTTLILGGLGFEQQ